MLLNRLRLLHVDVGNLRMLGQIVAGIVTMEALRRRYLDAPEKAVRLEDIDETLDVERHICRDAGRVGGDQQADWDVFGLERSGKIHRARPAHRVADQDDRRRIAAIVADRFLGDAGAHHRLIYSRGEPGLFDPLRQSIRTAREEDARKAAE